MGQIVQAEAAEHIASHFEGLVQPTEVGGSANPETGKPLDRSKLVRRFRAALERGGVRHITFHELRHTFGTCMAAEGTPLRTIQHWMGHADAKTTQIYSRYQPSDAEADTVDHAFA